MEYLQHKQHHIIYVNTHQLLKLSCSFFLCFCSGGMIAPSAVLDRENNNGARARRNWRLTGQVLQNLRWETSYFTTKKLILSNMTVTTEWHIRWEYHLTADILTRKRGYLWRLFSVTPDRSLLNRINDLKS